MAENGDVKTNDKDTDASDDVVSKITGQLMSDPSVLAAFGRKLDSMVGLKSCYIENLPKSVKRRLKALKKLQLEVFNVEAKFYEDVHMLEHKYAKLYQPLFDKRCDIISAAKEPTDSDCDWQSDDEDSDDKEKKTVDAEIADQLKSTSSDGKDVIAKDPNVDQPDTLPTTEDKKKTTKHVAEEWDENTKGIPEFWLTIFKNVEILSNLVQEHDEEALKKLKDIRVVFSDQVEEMYFELLFDFDENDFFDNKTLVKRYITRSSPDPSAPMTYDGPEIIKCIGCQINWKKDKDLTVKSIKQKVKGKGGVKKFVNKTIKADSFFNFFSPPEPPSSDKEGDDDENEEREAILLSDFEVGQLLQSSIIPKAVLYFTGEALEEDDEGEGEDDGDDEYEGDGEEDEETDPDYKPAESGKQECKQQ